MVSNKYIVIFMIGIFLTLGLGIMIGITLENQNIIENQQSQLIHEIEDHFVSLRTETEQMKLELDSLEEEKIQLRELSTLLLTELIQGKLTGVNVGLITFSNKAPIMELLDFLNLAGVSIQSSVTLVDDNNNILSNEKLVNTFQQPDELIMTIVQELIYSMQYGNVTPLIQEAMDFMLISHSGQFEHPVDYIILIRDETFVSDYENILIQNAIEENIPVIVVDSGKSNNGSLLKFKSMGISTVNQIETIFGKLALISILTGYKGNFDFSNNDINSLPSPLFYQKSQIGDEGSNTRLGGEK